MVSYDGEIVLKTEGVAIRCIGCSPKVRMATPNAPDGYTLLKKGVETGG